MVREAGKKVVIAGAGGNIGSQVVQLVARLHEVSEITLIDHGRYEHSNLFSQAITPASVGKFKALEQTRMVKRMRPDLKVTAICEPVEDVPLGILRADVILSCVDSRASRLYTAQAAWHLSTPWIDAGILSDAMLARIEAYRPGNDESCYECGYGDDQYALVQQENPCDGGRREAPATNAPAALGALAASLQAIECGKLFRAGIDWQMAGHQLLGDANCYRQYLTRMVRNPDCRADHTIWSIKRISLSASAKMSDVLRTVAEAGEMQGVLRLHVEEQQFVQTMQCTECGRQRKIFRLSRRLRESDRRCKSCRSETAAPAGFDMADAVSSEGQPNLMNQTLSRLGIRAGDILAVRDETERVMRIELASGTK